MQDYSRPSASRDRVHKILLGRDADAARRRVGPFRIASDATPPQNGRAGRHLRTISRSALPRRLSAQVHCDRRHGRRQVPAFYAIHGAGLDVQRAARRDYWRRIWCAKSARSTARLSNCRSGTRRARNHSEAARGATTAAPRRRCSFIACLQRLQALRHGLTVSFIVGGNPQMVVILVGNKDCPRSESRGVRGRRQQLPMSAMSSEGLRQTAHPVKLQLVRPADEATRLRANGTIEAGDRRASAPVEARAGRW